MNIIFISTVITPNKRQEEDLQVNIHVSPNLDEMSVSICSLIIEFLCSFIDLFINSLKYALMILQILLSRIYSKFCTDENKFSLLS